MCSICGYCKCPSGCPDTEDPPAVFICEICEGSIVVGDEYVDFKGDYYHRECFDELSTDELLEIIGGELREASEEDIDDGSDEEYERRRDEALFG